MEEKKKKSLKTWQKVVIALVAVALAIVVLPVTALIVWVAVDMYKDSKEVTVYEERIEDKELDIDKSSQDPFVEGEIKSTPVSLSSSGLESFEEYLKTVTPEYEYSDLYAIDESLELYNKKNITSVEKHAHDVRVNGKLDAEHLYELVLKNNDEFLSDENTLKGMYEVPSDSEIKELCQWTCEVLTEYEKAYPEIDMDTTCCNLYDLKILSPVSSFSNAHVDSRNIFNFDREQMDINEFIMDTDDIYTTTFYHEMVHLCQIKCDCFDNYGDWRTGTNNEYESVRTDPLCWYWLTEASAEMIESSHLGVQYSTYKAYIGYASSLNYIAQLDKNVGAEEVEKLNFGSDLEDVFEMFDIKTEDEKREFIKMMYSIEVLQMEPEEFGEAYEEKYGVELVRDTDEEESNRFCVHLKDDAMLSMTKLFYRNLARQISAGDTTLEDVFYLMRVWEGKLGYHSSCEIYFYNAEFSEFFKDYTAVQDEFFKLLSEENGISTEDLIKDFEAYSMNIQQGEIHKSPNCDLKFFTEEEKQYIKDFIELYYSTGFPSMRENVTISEKCAAEIKAFNESKETTTETVTEQ